MLVLSWHGSNAFLTTYIAIEHFCIWNERTLFFIQPKYKVYLWNWHWWFSSLSIDAYKLLPKNDDVKEVLAKRWNEIKKDKRQKMHVIWLIMFISDNHDKTHHKTKLPTISCFFSFDLFSTSF
jgi:hypothetical protein